VLGKAGTQNVLNRQWRNRQLETQRVLVRDPSLSSSNN